MLVTMPVAVKVGTTMRTAQFSGYPVTLRTTLSVAECQERLLMEFADHTGRWQHGRSDRRFVGWPTRDGCEIALSRRYALLATGVTTRVDTSRVCRIRLCADADGTTIEGVYRYVSPEQLLLGFVIFFTFGVPLGLMFAALGVYALIGQHNVAMCLFLLVCGLGLLGFGGWLCLDRSDGVSGVSASRSRGIWRGYWRPRRTRLWCQDR